MSWLRLHLLGTQLPAHGSQGKFSAEFLASVTDTAAPAATVTPGSPALKDSVPDGLLKKRAKQDPVLTEGSADIARARLGTGEKAKSSRRKKEKKGWTTAKILIASTLAMPVAGGVAVVIVSHEQGVSPLVFVRNIVQKGTLPPRTLPAMPVAGVHGSAVVAKPFSVHPPLPMASPLPMVGTTMSADETAKAVSGHSVATTLSLLPASPVVSAAFSAPSSATPLVASATSSAPFLPPQNGPIPEAELPERERSAPTEQAKSAASAEKTAQNMPAPKPVVKVTPATKPQTVPLPAPKPAQKPATKARVWRPSPPVAQRWHPAPVYRAPAVPRMLAPNSRVHSQIADVF